MREIALLALTILLLSTSIVLADNDGVTGTWKTADGRAMIEIYHCGAKICGRVAWLREPCFPADGRRILRASRASTGTIPTLNYETARLLACRSWKGLPVLETIVGNMGPSTTLIREEPIVLD